MICSTDESPGTPEKLDSDQVIKYIVLNCQTCLMQTLKCSLPLLKQESKLHEIIFALRDGVETDGAENTIQMAWQVCLFNQPIWQINSLC